MCKAMFGKELKDKGDSYLFPVECYNCLMDVNIIHGDNGQFRMVIRSTLFDPNQFTTTETNVLLSRIYQTYLSRTLDDASIAFNPVICPIHFNNHGSVVLKNDTIYYSLDDTQMDSLITTSTIPMVKDEPTPKFRRELRFKW